MSPHPDEFMSRLHACGYHPRSDKHSNALAEAIVIDLVRHCPTLGARAGRGEVVYDLNFLLRAGTADWNVDLVVGEAPLGLGPPPGGVAIARTRPATVQIAVDIKAVMTEHRKAVKNRKRDLEAHHEHVHNYNDQAIAAGVLVINAAPTFKSPLRPEVTIHREPDRLVAHCLDALRAVAARGGPRRYGLDAKCALVVSVDNQDLAGARFVRNPPVGDPLHYDGFIRTLCDLYGRRFGG